MKDKVSIEIAGITLAISDDDGFMENVRNHYSSFLTDNRPDFLVTAAPDSGMGSIKKPLKVEPVTATAETLNNVARVAREVPCFSFSLSLRHTLVGG